MAGGGELRSEPGEIDLLDKLATVFGSTVVGRGEGGCIFLKIGQLVIKKIEIEIIGSIMFIMNCSTSSGVVIVCENDWKR